MLTFIVVVVILFIGSRYYRDWQMRGDPVSRRKSFAWGWALIGAILGSFTGIAGFGGAIIGTVPGAILGWLIGSNLNKRDYGSGDRATDVYKPVSGSDSSVWGSPSSRGVKIRLNKKTPMPESTEKPDSLVEDAKLIWNMFLVSCLVGAVLYVKEYLL
ncbi:hypothetical protein DXI23_04540 [Marinobacter flavimaris]|uniref:Glycine zipper domain-containing protein n=1 Tax=Marinobacter flavimaris TaxID=262076 RepID=A0A3D8H874_9GAMM|nr:glycine zipper domain-containing protein [Marinobacter flavimaris]PPI79520.1 hypothetical protein MDHKLMBL_15325 [Marinobacter flavimaris]RDU42932.1 hypothetical protein DXI23_04540 [Marinobacter flavimaris]